MPTVTADVTAGEGEITAIDPLPGPMTIVWSAKDEVVPAESHAGARDRLPLATFQVLPEVGHVPMIDNPMLVAETIWR